MFCQLVRILKGWYWRIRCTIVIESKWLHESAERGAAYAQQPFSGQ